MAILSTVKKVIPYIKEAAGYVLCHISSQAVEMDDGTLLQDKIESMDSEIDGKANTSHTHTATQITGLTASRAMVSDGSGHPAVSNVTATELNYLDGATSNIQNQINTLNSNLDEKLIFAKMGDDIISVPANSWTHVAAIELEAGKYKIEWYVRIDPVSSNEPVWGTRITSSYGDSGQLLQRHVSNQANITTAFCVMDIPEKTTIYLQVFHSIPNINLGIHDIQFCITPLNNIIIA